MVFTRKTNRDDKLDLLTNQSNNVRLEDVIQQILEQECDRSSSVAFDPMGIADVDDEDDVSVYFLE